MAVFITTNQTYKARQYPKPNDDIDVRDKDESWALDYGKFIYGQYIAGNTGITPADVDKIELLRLYLDGNQPTEKYKKKFTTSLEEDRENKYGHINFDDIDSPMPKIVDKITGLFLGQEHSAVAQCPSEFSRIQKIEEKAQKYTSLKLRDTKILLDALIGLNPEEDPELNPAYSYIERDLNEIELLANAGSYKLKYEVAAERLIDFTKKLSNYRHIKRECIRDLLIGFTASREYFDADENVIRWDYLDIANTIIEYSNDHHFNKSRYFGIQEFWTIEDLRKKGFEEEKLKHLAHDFYDYNMGLRGTSNKTNAFNFYNRQYKHSKSYGYDDFIIPVLYFGFKSVDTKYYNRVTNKAGEDCLYPSDFGKVKDNTEIDAIEKVYEARWIMTSDDVFDFGVMAYIPRDTVDSVKMPVHVTKLKGKSIVERVVHILDEIAMLGYKLQNELARTVGKNYSYDFSSLEGITSNSGGKLKPLDLVKMFMEGKGLPYRSIPLDGNVNYSRPTAVTEFAGGIGAYLNELMVLKESYIRDIADSTGISTFEAPQSGTAVGIARLAVANMTDVLKPLYDIFLEMKEKISYNTVYRVQILLNDKNKGKKALRMYGDAIGSHYAEYLKMAYKTEPLQMGVTFEALPTEEMKRQVMEIAGVCLQPGKSGKPILKYSEYLYLVDRIHTQSGLKEARLLISHRETKDEIEARQMQKQAIESQGEQQQLVVETKGAIDSNKINQQKEADKELAILKSELDKGRDVDNHGADIIKKAMDMGASESQGQQQEQQQV